ncbi:molybdenum cofactor biosynthesis protein B [Candidatus Magnetomorum sp. HK-1]|nr:molybdenum cofactor biosynthesis protein B [Candidatus Magnetomorum sp. HK-1]
MSHPKHHKGNAPNILGIAIVTVSTSRTMDTDTSGQWMIKKIYKEGHRLETHLIVADDQEIIQKTVIELSKQPQVNVILMSGGTGLGPDDVTIEAVSPLFTKNIPAFGYIFSTLSYETIDSAALLSRATAGCIQDTLVFCMPGSKNAVKLACKQLIFCELNHIFHHVYENRKKA